MTPLPCVVGVSDHGGWAHLVCVAAPGGVPAVVERRRVQTIDAGVPTQPYHHDSLGMSEDDANALIARVRTAIDRRSLDALTRVVAELKPTYEAVAITIRTPSFPDLPESVADAWKVHRLLYAADGMLYQIAMCRAARALGLDVEMCPRSEEASRAAERLGVTPDAIEEFVTRTGRPAGPPWAQEQRRAFAGAIAALATRTGERLRI